MDMNLTTNLDNLDTIGGALNLDALDTPTRGRVALTLVGLTQKATQTGKLRLYFEYANSDNQRVTIGIWADKANEHFNLIRRTLNINAKGNALVQELADNPHTFVIRDDENGYPFISFVEMKGDAI